MLTAAVHNVRLVVAAALARGVPLDRLLSTVDLDIRTLLDPDGRVPVDRVLTVWKVAAELCGDPMFGLLAADHLQPDYFGGLGFAIHSSATVGDGIRRLGRFFHLVNQLVTLVLVEDGPLARIRIAVNEETHTAEDVRQPMECLLSALLVVERRATGTALVPAEVSFRHAAPAAHEAYVRRFGVMPRFDQPHYELAFPRDVLALPHTAADSGRISVAERHLRQMLDKLPRTETLSSHARRVLLEELRSGEPTLARVAVRLRVSERTLQRRLGEEQTSVQVLLEELRHELSLRYLADAKESIAEISFLLGFAEVRAFHRAFKRWTGSTPGGYRRASVPRLTAP
jgi:AraC-like DNA-binding protein